MCNKISLFLVFVLLSGAVVSCDHRVRGEFAVMEQPPSDPSDEVDMAELESWKMVSGQVDDDFVPVVDERKEENMGQSAAADSAVAGLLNVRDYRDDVKSIEDITLPAVCNATNDYVTGTNWLYALNYVALLCLCILGFALAFYIFFAAAGAGWFMMCTISGAGIALVRKILARIPKTAGRPVRQSVVPKIRLFPVLCKRVEDRKESLAMRRAARCAERERRAAEREAAKAERRAAEAEAAAAREALKEERRLALQQERAHGEAVAQAVGAPVVLEPDEDGIEHVVIPFDTDEDYESPEAGKTSGYPLVFPFIDQSSAWNRDDDTAVSGFANCVRLALVSGDGRFVIGCEEPVTGAFASALKALFDQDCRMDDFRAWIGHDECFFRFPEETPDHFCLDFAAGGNAGAVWFSVLASIDDVLDGSRARFMQALKTNIALDRIRYPEIPGIETVE